MNIFNSPTSLPGLANIKDVNSTFIAFSQDFARLLGWRSADDSLGKNDYDLPCDAVQFADEFIHLDKKVIHSGERMLALDVQPYYAGWKLILAEKNPLRDAENNITGIYSHCIDVTEVSIFKTYFSLHQLDNKLCGKNIKPASYILTDVHSLLPLTEKQKACLFFLIRGKSFKEIARLLQISPRTVECHFDAIKTKLHCDNKADLICKAIDSGFLYYIPHDIQKQQTVITAL